MKMPLGMEVGLGPGDCIRYGPSSPPQKGGAAPPNFWPMSIVTVAYCGQTAGWIKMLLRTEVNLGPGDVVLDGVAAPP